MIEQVWMDWVGLFKLASVVFVSAALREIVGAFPIKLGELLQGVVPMHVLVARYLLEEPTPNDFIAFFLRRRPPRTLHAAKSLLEACQRFLPTFATDFDLGRG